MDINKILIGIIACGAVFFVTLGIKKEKHQIACIESLREKFETISTNKKVIQNVDNGLLVLTSASISSTRAIGFLSPLQYQKMPNELKKNGIRILTLKKTGKCIHETSGFEYITFETEYTDDTKQL
jgi:hypothetical protein